MERHGVLVDPSHLDSLSVEFAHRAAQIQEEIFGPVLAMIKVKSFLPIQLKDCCKRLGVYLITEVE